MKKTINPVPGHQLGLRGWATPAIRTGDIIFASGMVGRDPSTGEVVAGTEAQIRCIFQRIRTALDAHGASLDDVVKMTMYFTDRKGQWPIFDRIRREIFTNNPPASTGVGVTELSDSAEVEVEVIAMVSDPKPAKSKTGGRKR